MNVSLYDTPPPTFLTKVGGADLLWQLLMLVVLLNYNAYLVEKTAKNFHKTRSNNVLDPADWKRLDNSLNSFFLRILDDHFNYPMTFLNLGEEKRPVKRALPD